MIDRKSLTQKRRAEICLTQEGRCNVCKAKLRPGFMEADHIQALEHGGDNETDNWQMICSLCHKDKTRKDHQARYKVDRIAIGGRQRKGPPMPGTKASGIRKRMNGQVERR